MDSQCLSPATYIVGFVNILALVKGISINLN